MKKFRYRGYHVDVHPYAGGFKAFIFPPNGRGTGLEPTPILAGPDGNEPILLERLLRDVQDLIDRHVAEATLVSIH